MYKSGTYKNIKSGLGHGKIQKSCEIDIWFWNLLLFIWACIYV